MPDSKVNQEIWAVVPAGGSGSRFSPAENKLLANLAGVPVLVRTLQGLLSVPGLSGVLLATSEVALPQYQVLVAEHLPGAPVHFTLGGQTRRESVFRGLQALPETVEIAVIHDAARPLISPEIVDKAVFAVRDADQAGAVVALPMHDTVKKTMPGQSVIQETLDRSGLWRAQTPQVFPKALILQAHRQVPTETAVTDDAQLMELAGLGPVALVEGQESNLKITTQADIRLAEAYLQL